MTNEPLGLVVDITANVEKFKRAIDEQLNPALNKAIIEAIENVLDGFTKSALGDCIELSEPRQPLGEELAAAADRLPRFPKGGIVGAGVISRGEKVFGQ